MGAGRFVGRVGGLAVVLGVGAAVSVGNAVAWADEGGSSESSSGSSSSGASSSTSSSSPSSKGQHQRPATRGKTKKPATDAADASDGSGAAPAAADTPKLPSKTTKNRQFGSSANKPNKASTPKPDLKPDTKIDSKPETKVKLSPASTGATPSAAVAVQSTAAVSPVATSSVVSATSQVTVSSTESAKASTPSALTEISQALLGTGPEGSPVASPLSWVVAAAARRELGAVSTAAVSAAGTTTSTNHNPVIKTVTVGKPDASTGQVAGTVTATDADADALTYSASGSTKGTVTIDATTGAYTYTPTATARHNAATGVSATKTDTFTVTASDANGGVANKTVTVTVQPANAAPVIAPTNSSPDPVTGVVTGNINVTDADGDTLTISTTVTTKKGKLTLDKTTGAFTYTPTAAAMHAAATGGTAAQDTFTVKVTDAHGGTTTKVVTVPINATNINPVVTSPLTATKTSPTSGVVTGKITVTDADKDKLTYTATTDTTKGKVSVSSTGAFTFTPTAAARHAAAADGATDADKQTTVTVTVTDGHGGTPITQTVTVDIVGKNANPGGVTVKVGKADTTTGVVTGTVKATDADKDSLTYRVNATSTKGGTVSIDGAGNITYTASDAARYAAGAKGATSATKTDTITVNVTDGHGGLTTKIVTVAVAPLAATSQGSVSNPGSVTISGNSSDAVFNADGSRAIITTKGTDGTSTYTVVNPLTRQQVGTATTLTGDAWTAQFSANGSRAVIYTDAKNASNVDITNVAVIDTVNGAQLGTTVTLTGVVSNTLPFNSAGDRAVVVAFGTNNNAYTGQIAILDLLTGLQVGTTTSVTGDSKASSVNVKLNAQGTRAVVTLETSDASNNLSTSLSIIDTDTGDAVGTAATVAGASNAGTQIAAGGTHAVLAVTNKVGDVTSTTVKVFNLATGETATYTQEGTGSAQLTDDGTRLVVNTGKVVNVVDATGTVVSSTPVGVITTYDAVSGSNLKTVEISGVSTYLPVQFNGDQSRAVVTVYNLLNYQGQTYVTNTGVAVVNTATGAQVGNVVKINGEPVFDDSGPVNVQLNSDGSRAVITGVVTASATSTTTYFAVVNTTTGLQLGKTLKMSGGLQPGREYDTSGNVTAAGYEMLPVFTADGKRAIIATFAGSTANGYATHVALLNLETGAKLGNTINLTGGVDIAGDNKNPVVQLGTSDTRALITTYVGDDETLYTTRIVLLNTQTGAQIGSTRSYTSYYQTSTQFSEDGNRVIFNTDDLKFNGNDFVSALSTLTLLDAYTGSPIGSPVKYEANEWTWSTAYGSDTRVALVQISSDANGVMTTKITVVDPITGAVIGSPITVDGDADTVSFGADSSTLVVTTITGDDTAGYTTKVTFLKIDPVTTVI